MNLQKEKRKNKENYSNCITVNIFIQTNLQTLATFINSIVIIEMKNFQVIQRMYLIHE